MDEGLTRYLKHSDIQLTSRISSPISRPLVDEAIPLGLIPAMKQACGKISVDKLLQMLHECSCHFVPIAMTGKRDADVGISTTIDGVT